MTGPNDYPSLDKIQVPFKPGGKTIMTFAVSAFLLFRGSETPGVRQAPVDALGQYQARFPEHVTHFQKRMARRMTAIGADSFTDTYRAELAKIDPEFDDWAGTVGSLDPLSQYGATCMAKREMSVRRHPLGYFRAWYPCAYAETNAADLIAAVISWCNLLRPEQGQVGLTTLFEWGMERSYPHVYWHYLSRFNGLEFNWAFGLSARAERGLKSINWLTILDDAYVAELGGIDALSDTLGEQATIHHWDGGILIQACAEPQLGDTHANAWPEAYVDVNAALRPIRFEAYRNSPMSLIDVPEPLDAYEETLKWVRRFDREAA
ncbi:MAG: DUF3396 domain-containing protein [Erythrobacter sp.]|uniref:type VI immunity family protein n=1 Tax=Erythrobacter sp. TaxID=1042 RepID=UPI001AFEB003|nr:type VI immunity family protein [Erythrobacter sp.]MBO6767350.1 DUF3396 domain-containing protein [Erythrobacter sp.]